MPFIAAVSKCFIRRSDPPVNGLGEKTAFSVSQLGGKRLLNWNTWKGQNKGAFFGVCRKNPNSVL